MTLTCPCPTNLSLKARVEILLFRPESKGEKAARLVKEATTIAEEKNKEAISAKPYTLKPGLNHVVSLIENKKPALVLIANDVNPIELVVFLPALCRRMGVTYGIVKGKARLGALVRQKTAAVVAINAVRAEDKMEMAKLVEAIREGYLAKHQEVGRMWGGGVMGAKAQARMEKRRKAMENAVKI